MIGHRGEEDELLLPSGYCICINGLMKFDGGVGRWWCAAKKVRRIGAHASDKRVYWKH